MGWTSKFKQIRSSVEGALSVEFALVAPALITISLAGVNLGYQLHLEQKLTASVQNGSDYLQDWVMANDLNDLAPTMTDDDDDNESEEWKDSDPVVTTKTMVSDAFGKSLGPEDVEVEFICGCPDSTGIDTGSGTVSENYTGYFVKTSQKDYGDVEELCPSTCNNGMLPRIIVELNVDHETKDLFNNSLSVSETQRSRLR